MTVAPYQLQLRAPRSALCRRQKRSEEHRLHASYPVRRAIGADGGKSHLSLESNQFAHASNRAARWGARGTMKLCVSQGIAV